MDNYGVSWWRISTGFGKLYIVTCLKALYAELERLACSSSKLLLESLNRNKVVWF